MIRVSIDRLAKAATFLRLRISPILFSGAAVLLGTGVVTGGGGVASASFSGTNGNLVWSAICAPSSSPGGQQIWSALNNASGLTCPSSAITPSPVPSPNPYYLPVTAGPTDSMAYFSSAGTSVYFSSTRTNSHGTNANAIWWVPYTNTVSASGDGASELTAPSSGGDFAPTVSATTASGVSTLAYIHCGHLAASGTASSCALWTEPLVNNVPSGSATQLSTVNASVVAPASPNEPSGDTSRPEIDPANSNLVAYVDTNSQIHIATLSGTSVPGYSQSDVNLSALGQCPACLSGQTAPEGSTTFYGDEHPDWSPDGTTLVFDSFRQGNFAAPNANNMPFTVTNLFSSAAAPTIAPVWNGIPSGYASDSEIEPVYAPNTGTGPGQTPDYNTNPGSGTPPTLAWITDGGSPNVTTLDDGTIKNPDLVTNDATNNIDVDWQPTTTLGAPLPESPLVIALPFVGGGALFGAGLINGRRSRKRPVTA